MEETSLGTEIAAAMGETSTQTPAAESVPTGDVAATQETATTAPAETTPAPVTTDPTTSKQGPIPFEVHHTALANARTKAVQEAQAQWDQAYGFAKLPGAREIFEKVARSAGNPIAFFAEQFDELANDARFAPQLRSFIGQRLGQFRGQQSQQAPQGPTMPDPDVAIYDAAGNVVGQTYSAQAQAQREAVLKQQWLQDVNHQLAQVRGEFAPVVNAYQDATLKANANTFAAETMQVAEKWPGMHPETDKENRAAVSRRIAVLMAQVPPDQLRDERMAPIILKDALKQAWLDEVLPKLQMQARRDIVTTQQQKAQVNTASPSNGSTGTPKSYSDMTWSEAFQHELAAKR
jgi:hypothetical protein